MFPVIIVTCPDTVFGKIEKTFASYERALEYMNVCTENDVPFTVGYSHK